MLKFNRLPIVRKVNRWDFKQYIHVACKLAIYIYVFGFLIFLSIQGLRFLYTPGMEKYLFLQTYKTRNRFSGN